MKETPLDAFKNGRQHALPYMLVANLGELSTRPGAYLIPAYLGLLSGAAKTGVKAHAIIFDGIPAGWRKEGCFSFHAIELGYVFGDWDNSGGFWTSVFMMANSAGAKSRDPGLTEADRTISEIMMTMWTRYATDGEPAVEGLIACPAWNDKENKYLFIDEHPVVKTGYSQLPAGPK
jgi:carboxylesterase type B